MWYFETPMKTELLVLGTKPGSIFRLLLDIHQTFIASLMCLLENNKEHYHLESYTTFY